MISGKKNIRIIVYGSAVIALSLVFLCMFSNLISTPKIVKVFDSPNKAYRLEVWENQQFAHMPGDALSGDGFIVIKSSDGNVLKKADIDLVSSVDKVMWNIDEVFVPGVGAVYKLPKQK